MKNEKYAPIVMILFFVFISTTKAMENSEPNAAELVQTVRESENWIHNIDNIQFKVEGKWSHSPESIAARRAELKKLSPDEEPDPNRNWELKPSFGDKLEYAIDFKNKRIRYLVDEPNRDYRLHVLNRNLLKRYAKPGYNSEQYDLYSDTKMLESLFGSLSWPKSQPHSFWWEPKDVNETMHIYGHPEDFRLVGKEIYKNIPCYVLEYDYIRKEDLWKSTFKFYVGIEDHLLYGRIEGVLEFWTLNYKEIIPGCKISTVQGYSFKRTDREYADFQRDAKLFDIKINNPLPEELFQMEFKEGLPVFDARSGKLVIYNYVAEPVSLISKPLPEIMDLGINSKSLVAEKKMILICFFDYEQRPSRNCILQIAKESEQLKEQSIQIAAIHASQIDRKTLDEWIKDNNINFPVGIIQDEEKKTQISWGVKSLPWLILTDKNHIVKVEGFAYNELNEKISEIKKNALND